MSKELFGTDSDPEDFANPTIMTVDRAYAGSSRKTFLGKEISGWSGRRRAATFEIGFTGSGGVVDPIRVVYCCIISPAEVSEIFRGKALSIEKFLQWAEENECIDPSAKNWEEAFHIAQEILEEVEKSEFETADSGNPTNLSLGNSIGHQD